MPPPTSGPSLSSVSPTQVPLPEDSDDDFPPPNQLAARVAHPAQVVGRVCHSESKGKGKNKENEPPVKAEKKQKRVPSPIPVTRKYKGRVTSAANYTECEIDQLLDLLAEDLPLGASNGLMRLRIL